MFKTKQNNFLRNLLLSLLLLTLCVGATELAFCHKADPRLFYEVTGPVISVSKTAAVSAANAISSAAASTYKAVSSAAASVSTALSSAAKTVSSIFTFKTVTINEPTDSASASDGTAPAPVTELDTSTDKEILTGGTPLYYYNQKDEAWAYQLFGNDNIGSYGCGPTALAMTVSSLVRFDTDPAKMASWCASEGYWAPGDGSYLSIVKGTADHFGLQCVSLGKPTADVLREKLGSGGVIVALMGRGHFTRGGHFILLHGVTEDGKILVADPNSRENSLALWDAETIVSELSSSTDSGAPLWHVTY